MPKKKTHEEYVAELKEKNPTIIPIEKYVNSSSKSLHKCLVCGNEWKVKPAQLLRGHACPKCAKNILSQEEFEKKIRDCNGIDVLSEYKSSKEKVKCKCLKCGHVWEAAPNHLLEGHGCPNCGGVKKKSHEEYVQQLKLVNPRLEVVGKYINAKTPIRLRCLTHNYVFEAIPINTLNKSYGCKYCKSEKIRLARTMSENEFMNKLEGIGSGSIKLETPYVRQKSIMDFYCKKCGTRWQDNGSYILTLSDCPYCSGIRKNEQQIIDEIESYNKVTVIDKNIFQPQILVMCNICGYVYNGDKFLLRHGSGCKKCSDKQHGLALRKSNEQFIKEMSLIHPEIIVLSEYANVNSLIKCKCLLCGNVWDTSTADNLLRGSGCPKCSLSILEKECYYYFSARKMIHVTQKKFTNLVGVGGKQLSYDFFVPHYNLLIECQGEQHYRPVEYFGGIEQFKIQQEHDRRKREYAQNNNINLLEIRYDQDVSIVLDEYFQTHSPLKKYTKIQPLSRIKNNLKLESVETVIPA